MIASLTGVSRLLFWNQRFQLWVIRWECWRLLGEELQSNVFVERISWDRIKHFSIFVERINWDRIKHLSISVEKISWDRIKHGSLGDSLKNNLFNKLFRNWCRWQKWGAGECELTVVVILCHTRKAVSMERVLFSKKSPKMRGSCWKSWTEGRQGLFILP